MENEYGLIWRGECCTMTKERKDTVTVVSAVAMLCFGCILTTIGFFMHPSGEVHDSVLWILGQCLIYAGGALGIANYAKASAQQEVDRRFNEIERGNHHRRAGAVQYPDNTGGEFDYEKGGEDETEQEFLS